MEFRIVIPKVCVKGNGGVYVCRAVPFSPNKLNTLHWAVRKRWTDAWQEMVWMEAKSLQQRTARERFVFPFNPAEVAVTLFTRRPQDDDNAMASLKPIVDGLRYAGIIKDDAPNYCTTLPPKSVVAAAKEERTEIVVRKRGGLQS